MSKKTFLFILLGLLAGGVIFALLHSNSGESDKDQERIWASQTYQKLIDQQDPELTGGKVVVTHCDPGADYEWRLAIYQADGKTPVVYKDLLKPDYYGNNDRKNKQFFVGIPVRYQYFRADGTLERTKRVEPMPVIGASCEHIMVEEFYSADGKQEVAAKYIRENGEIAATFKKEGRKDTWTHYRKDGSLAHIQVSDENGFYYTHYRRDGKSVWWTTENLSNKPGTGKVFFDWQGNAVNLQYTRRSLITGGGYSMGPTSPPMPVYEDTYTRADGTPHFRQTWVDIWSTADDTTVHALAKLEIFSADGKQVERTITFDPKPFTQVRAVTADSAPGTAVPEFMHHGYDMHTFDWTREHADDI